jgi:predicted nuclease of predicted toxin-antitoxin system
MLRLLADENIRGAIIHGLVLRLRDIEIVRAVDAGLANTPDEVVLERAANDNRIVVSHDKGTMIRLAFDRIRLGQPMPGLIILHDWAPDQVLIEHLLIAIEASEPFEWVNQVVYLPWPRSVESTG